MTTATRFLGLFMVAAVLIGGSTAPAGVATAVVSKYHAIDLGTLGGTSSRALALNANDQVVGQSATAGGQDHAFSWTQAGGMVDLGAGYADAVNDGGQVVGNLGDHPFSWTQAEGATQIGTTLGFAAAVNSVGQVVGQLNSADFSRTFCFLWTKADGLSDLGTLFSGNYCIASAVNETGQVVGTSGTQIVKNHAFLWTRAGGMVDLGTLGGTYSAASPTIQAVNGSGEVVGESTLTPDGATHAFSWTPAGGMHDLGTLGGTNSRARAVNDSGQVVGSSDTSGGATHAFLWTAGAGMVDLGTLGGTSSYADAVNASGQVVGESTTATGETHAFSWTQAAGIVDLGTLGGTISYGPAVNDGGQVAGTSSITNDAESHAALWQTSTATGSAIHVVGTQIVDAAGTPLVLRGVDYSGTEYMCVQGAPTPSTHGRGIFENWPNPPTPPEVLASWGINAVRLPLNEDCWLGINGVDPSFGGASYRQAVIDYANALVAHGIVPILELSGSAPGTSLAGFDQQPMPDRDHSIDFWRELATTFRDDGQVLFDLFNEPFPDGNQDTVAAWTCWRDGGSACPGLTYDAVGMQELVNTVRATGAPNLILLGGVQYSRINANWLSYRPSDPGNNLAASWHLYPNAYCPTQACWDTQFQSFVSQAAAVATEIGQGGSAPCGVDFLDRAMLWLDAHDQGYLAWTWDAWGDCFSLIANWGNTAPPFAPTSSYGRTYHDHLLGIPQPPTGVVAAAGDGTAAVSWQAPVDHGSSAISSYRVTPHDQTAGSDRAAVVATGSSTTVTGLTNGHVYTFSATAVNNAGTSASSSASNAVTPQAGYPTPAAATATASTDQTTTVSTGNDPAATGGTSTLVTVPTGTTGGTVTVGQTGTNEPAPIGYLFGGVQVDIAAPAASAANPLTLVFTTTPPADQAPPPDPATLASTEIYRAEGTGLPTLVPDCNGAPGQAQPDPCVASRQYVSINGQTDIRLTVLSSSASHWNSARPKAAAVTVSDKSYSPANVTIQPGADVNWAFAGRKPHSVTDNVGLGSSATPLFDSGPKSSGTYRFNFPSSGTFTYSSTAKGDLLSGAVLVPVVATPTSGRTTTAFTVIWSTRGLPGYVFDVQYRFKPAGATGWKNWANWKTGATATSAAFTPGQGAGTYAFHARLRNLATGRASAFSPDTTAVTASS
jgi:endoglucanase